MPLIKLNHISTSQSFAIWQIEETLNDLVSQLHPMGSDLLYNEIKHEIKKKEFVTGRLAIKHLVEDLDTEYRGTYKDEWGKPFLKNSAFHVSLSHCFPYVAAILNKATPTGIDIQIFRDQLVKLAPKFLNNAELQLAGEDLLKLGVFWAAKEALYKLYGRKRLVFRENLAISPFELQREGQLQGYIDNGEVHLSRRLTYFLDKEYVLCYTH